MDTETEFLDNLCIFEEVLEREGIDWGIAVMAVLNRLPANATHFRIIT